MNSNAASKKYVVHHRLVLPTSSKFSGGIASTSGLKELHACARRFHTIEPVAVENLANSALWRLGGQARFPGGRTCIRRLQRSTCKEDFSGSIAFTIHFPISAMRVSSGSTMPNTSIPLLVQQSFHLTRNLARSSVTFHRKLWSVAQMARKIFMKPPQILKNYHNVDSNTKLTIIALAANEGCNEDKYFSFFKILPYKNSSTSSTAKFSPNG